MEKKSPQMSKFPNKMSEAHTPEFDLLFIYTECGWSYCPFFSWFGTKRNSALFPNQVKNISPDHILFDLNWTCVSHRTGAPSDGPPWIPQYPSAVMFWRVSGVPQLGPMMSPKERNIWLFDKWYESFSFILI